MSLLPFSRMWASRGQVSLSQTPAASSYGAVRQDRPQFDVEPLDARRLLSVTAYEVFPVGDEYPAAGVEVSWSTQPWTRAMNNESTSLTLDVAELGGHYEVVVSGRLDIGQTYDGTDLNHVDVAIGSAQTRLTRNGDEATPAMDFELVAEHDTDQLVVTFSGSDFETAEGDSWYMLDLVVTLRQYQVSVESSTIVEGDSSTIAISATKEDGSVAAGVQLSAFGYDAAVISPTTSVTTDSAGKATAEVQATTKGTSRLGYRGPTTRPSTGPGASTAPSTQRVVRPKVILEASYAVPFTADQKKRFSVKVVNEDDTTELLNGVELQIVGPATNPYYEIDWVVFVHGETSTSGNITVGGLGHFELNSKGQISGQGPSFTIKVKNGTAGDSAFVVVQPPGT